MADFVKITRFIFLSHRSISSKITKSPSPTGARGIAHAVPPNLNTSLTAENAESAESAEKFIEKLGVPSVFCG
jgi:hypothetical protein